VRGGSKAGIGGCAGAIFFKSRAIDRGLGALHGHMNCASADVRSSAQGQL
jgi:hypothetical protein